MGVLSSMFLATPVSGVSHVVSGKPVGDGAKLFAGLVPPKGKASQKSTTHPQKLAAILIDIQDLDQKVKSLLANKKSGTEGKSITDKASKAHDAGLPTGKKDIEAAADLASEMVSILMRLAQIPAVQTQAAKTGNIKPGNTSVNSTGGKVSTQTAETTLLVQLAKELSATGAAAHPGKGSEIGALVQVLKAGQTTKKGHADKTASPIADVALAIDHIEDILRLLVKQTGKTGRTLTAQTATMTGTTAISPLNVANIAAKSAIGAVQGQLVKPVKDANRGKAEINRQEMTAIQKDPSLTSPQHKSTSSTQPKSGTATTSTQNNTDSRVSNIVSLIVDKAQGHTANGTPTENSQIKANTGIPAIQIDAATPLPLEGVANIGPTWQTFVEKTASIQSAKSAHQSPAARFSGAIIQQIQSTTITADRTIIQLSPSGLGSIEIEIKNQDDGALHITVRADNPAVLSTLRGDRDTVMQALSQVSQNTNGTSLDFQEFNRNSNEQNKTGPAADTRSSPEQDSSSNLPIHPQHAPVISRDQLDIIA